MASPETRLWLRDVECGARFGVRRQTWRRWAHEGRAPKPVKLGPNVSRWSVAEVEQSERAQREAAE